MESENEVEATDQIPEPSIVKNRDSNSSESEGEPRVTQSPAKPSPDEQVYLIGGDGQRLPFVSSLHHILIDGADKDLTRDARDKTLQHVKLITFVGEPGKSPSLLPQLNPKRLFAMRRQLWAVNQTLRFPDDSMDLAAVAREYNEACAYYF